MRAKLMAWQEMWWLALELSCAQEIGRWPVKSKKITLDLTCEDALILRAYKQLMLGNELALQHRETASGPGSKHQ